MNLLRRLLAVPVLSVLLALAACGERDGSSDTAAKARERIASANHRLDEAPRQAGAAGASRDAPDPGAPVAASRTGDRIDDMQITTRVNAGLAADKELSAVRIDVDTHEGVVTLMGTAPTMTAKMRAADVARQVKNVKSVDNQLSVGG